ncbi:hypothetical protein V8F33_010034 [Rhypophila sp. PSN 637]
MATHPPDNEFEKGLESTSPTIQVGEDEDVPMPLFDEDDVGEDIPFEIAEPPSREQIEAVRQARFKVKFAPVLRVNIDQVIAATRKNKDGKISDAIVAKDPELSKEFAMGGMAALTADDQKEIGKSLAAGKDKEGNHRAKRLILPEQGANRRGAHPGSGAGGDPNAGLPLEDRITYPEGRLGADSREGSAPSNNGGRIGSVLHYHHHHHQSYSNRGGYSIGGNWGHCDDHRPGSHRGGSQGAGQRHGNRE